MTAPDDARARLSIDERISLLSGEGYWRTAKVPGVPQLVLSDGPHGVGSAAVAEVLAADGVLPSVAFPTSSTLASSWDRGLARRQGAGIAQEARRLGVNVILGPGINIKRTPLCGRNFEYLSEDPVLSGELGAALISSIEAGGVGATVKHFAANNQEFDRMVVNAVVDDRALREIYLKGFEIAVRGGQPTAVMSAYNSVNGTPAVSNPFLLTDVLRNEWHFDGIVMSDWGSVDDRVASLRAGLDLEMPGSNGAGAAAVKAALEAGEIDESLIDRSSTRVADAARRLAQDGPADPAQDNSRLRRLARDIAAECIILLRNEDDLLPLDADSRKLTYAVVGEFAAHPRIQGGGSAGVVTGPVASALDEIRRQVGDASVIYSPGFDSDATNDALLEEAREAAERADVVLLFVGLSEFIEAESYDRENLELPESHTRLIHELVAANENVVVILHKGSVVNMSGWNDKVRAIIDVGLGGEGVGSATADVLFGTVNPSGHLAETVPRRLEDTPAYLNYPGSQNRVVYHESIWVGYRYYDKREMEVQYPFGYGLSYTEFDFGKVQLDTRDVIAGSSVTGSVLVTNVGQRAGKAVVQIYVHDVESSAPRPENELKAFEKVALEPGETGLVRFTLPPDAFSFWDEARSRWTTENGEFQIRAAASSRDIRSSTTLVVRGGVQTAEVLSPKSPVRQFLGLEGARDIVTVATNSIPMFAGIAQADPLTRKIVAEVIKGMPLGRLVTVTEGQFSDDAMNELLSSLD
jgi:beta-glucosidase